MMPDRLWGTVFGAPQGLSPQALVNSTQFRLHRPVVGPPATWVKTRYSRCAPTGWLTGTVWLAQELVPLVAARVAVVTSAPVGESSRNSTAARGWPTVPAEPPA